MKVVLTILLSILIMFSEGVTSTSIAIEEVFQIEFNQEKTQISVESSAKKIQSKQSSDKFPEFKNTRFDSLPLLDISRLVPLSPLLHVRLCIFLN